MDAVVRTTKASRGRDATSVRLGFVPLIDAAPLIVAHELGYFTDEGLSVSLQKQIGWGNVNDKLQFGKLHASHALLGSPVTSAMDVARPGLSVIAVMALGTGGDAITIDRRLFDQGITTAAMLARMIRLRRREPEPPVLAHVFDHSVHHYLLRDWLANAQLSPDDDAKLCVLPPAQMPAHLQKGYLAGMCVGEPWNTLAQINGYGRIVALTTDIAPAHPDKVLAVHRDWAERHPDAVVRLIRAVVRACSFCDAADNHAALAEMLGRPAYLDLPATVIQASLQIDRSFGVVRSALPSFRPADWLPRSFAFDTLFPKPQYATWLLERMLRWGHIDAATNIEAVAAQAMVGRYFTEAARGLGLDDTEQQSKELEHAR